MWWEVIKMYKWQIIIALLAGVLVFMLTVKRVEGGSRLTTDMRVTILEARVDSLQSSLLRMATLASDQATINVDQEVAINSLVQTDIDLLTVIREVLGGEE